MSGRVIRYYAWRERQRLRQRIVELWRCGTCGVRMLERDQLGHAARAHGGVARFDRCETGGRA